MAKRVIDEDFEKKIKERVDSYLKTASDQLEVAKAGTLKTKDDVERSICEKPVEWVAGAFVAGLLLGKILSK